jgi:hypothetical protein
LKSHETRYLLGTCRGAGPSALGKILSVDFITQGLNSCGSLTQSNTPVQILQNSIHPVEIVD